MESKIDVSETLDILVNDPHLDFGDYMAIVAKVMEIVAEYPNLSGADKKELVVQTIVKYAELSNDDLLKTILSETTTRNLIEIIYAAYTHRIVIKKTAKKIKGFCC